jgi:phage terminase large subunit
MGRHLPEHTYDWSQKRLGLDVARYGDDRTVIFPRQGLASFQPVIMRHDRGSAVSVDIATRVAAAKTRWGSELEFADATGGWSAGACDVLRASGIDVIDVQFAAPAVDPRYYNMRAQIWFEMAEWVKRGAALPNLPELLGELTSPTYVFHRGKFQLEDKDQVKARLGRSPDLADALALTFAMPDMPAAMHGRRSVGKAITEDNQER